MNENQRGCPVIGFSLSDKSIIFVLNKPVMFI